MILPPDIEPPLMTAIPDYQSLMLPLLRLSTNGAITLRAAVQALGEQFGLTPEQIVQKLPSGQAVIYNRTGWAKTELAKAGLIEQHERGAFNVTHRGRALLEEMPERIDRKFLLRYPEFAAYIAASQQRAPKDADGRHSSPVTLEPTTQTPTERIDAAVAETRPNSETNSLTASSPSRISRNGRPSSRISW